MEPDEDPSTRGSPGVDAAGDGGRPSGGTDACDDPPEPEAIEPQGVNPEHAAFVLLGIGLMVCVILTGL